MKQTTSFGKFSEMWDRKTGNNGDVAAQETIKAVFKLAGELKGKKVYEIACGNGFLARKFIKKGASEVFASDISPELIVIAKQKYSTTGITYLTRDANNFNNLLKNNFDIVVIHCGMFYIKDIDKLLRGVASILKPNGSFIFNLSHPLLPLTRLDIGALDKNGKVAELVEACNDYLSLCQKVIKRDWWVDNGRQPVSYLKYYRPISYYINLCGKNGLLVSAMSEPKSVSSIKGVIKKSKIPKSLVIKTIKINN